MMNKIKILHVLPSLASCNGVANFVYNFVSNMDLSKFEVSVIVHDDSTTPYAKELIKKKIKIYSLPNIKFFNGSIKKIKEFYSREKFDIIHCHSTNLAAFHFMYPKNVVKILHSHSISLSESILKYPRNTILKYMALYNSDNFLACSKEAGNYLFGNKEFIIVNNAIDKNKYLFSPDMRKLMRNKYSLKKEFVIGHVGRFSRIKNHKFLVDVFVKFNKKHNAKLMMVGNGELKDNVKNYCIDKGIIDDVIFIDETDKCQDYYQMMDCFLLPSLSEGLGMVLIEAQYNGIECIASKGVIPKEVVISKSIRFCDLNNINSWVLKLKELYTDKVRKVNSVTSDDYDISKEVLKLEDIYIKLGDKYEKD